MKDFIAFLREKNPLLRIVSVFDDEFKAYGRVLTGFDTSRLSACLGETEIPPEGNCYVASDPKLEALDVVQAMGAELFGEMPVQAGYCNGRGYTLNAEEYHKCSEINFCTGDGAVLLLARFEDMENYTLDVKKLVGFYLPAGVPVEIYPRVLHFAPCRVSEEGFRCLVILEKGTNQPLEKSYADASGEGRLLWMKNKWLLCHPDSPQCAKGAYVGIRGENIRLHI